MVLEFPTQANNVAAAKPRVLGDQNLHDCARTANLREVIAMLLEDGDPKLESEFVGLQTIQVA